MSRAPVPVRGSVGAGMKRIACGWLAALILSGCVVRQGPEPVRVEGPPPPPPPPPARVVEPVDDAQPACGQRSTLEVRKRQQYEDHYGTMLTSDRAWLRTPGGSYRWGISNSGRLEMAYFAAYLKPGGKWDRFRARVYVDGGVKADMIFTVRAERYDGEVLKTLTVPPGGTRTVDVEVPGVKRLFIGSELRINHSHAEKLVIGEPEFYRCR